MNWPKKWVPRVEAVTVGDVLKEFDRPVVCDHYERKGFYRPECRHCTFGKHMHRS